MQNAPLGAFCNTFDLHYVIIGLKNQFWVFPGMAVLYSVNCMHKFILKIILCAWVKVFRVNPKLRILKMLNWADYSSFTD